MSGKISNLAVPKAGSFLAALSAALIAFVLFSAAATAAAEGGLRAKAVPSAAYVAIANYFYKHGGTGLAVRLFEKAVESDNSAVARHNLGIIYYNNGDYAKAEEEFRKAVEANPGYPRAHNSLALLLFHQQRYAEAAKHFGKAVELSPENAQAHFDLAVSLGNNVRYGNGSISDVEEALEHFRRAERLQPGYPHAAKNIGVVEDVLAKYYELKGSLT